MRGSLRKRLSDPGVEKLALEHRIPYTLAERICDVLANNEIPTFSRYTLEAILGLSCPRELDTRASIFAIQAWLTENRGIWITERLVKAAVKHLVEVHEIALGSSRGAKPGYFFIVDDAAAQAATRPLLAEIRSLAKRCRALDPRRNRYLKSLLGQMEVQA